MERQRQFRYLITMIVCVYSVAVQMTACYLTKYVAVVNEKGGLCVTATLIRSKLSRAVTECAIWCFGHPDCTFFNFFDNSTCELMTKSECVRASYITGCNAFVMEDRKPESYAASEENLALRREATQSSTRRDGYACKAVDGNAAPNLSSNSCAHINDSQGGPNWWRVKLDQAYRVQRVTVTNRGDCCGYRLDKFIVGVTNLTADPVRGAYPLCGQYPSTVAPGATVALSCDPNISAGQYVIIQQPVDGKGWLTLCEVEVYA